MGLCESNEDGKHHEDEVIHNSIVKKIEEKKHEEKEDHEAKKVEVHEKEEHHVEVHHEEYKIMEHHHIAERLHHSGEKSIPVLVKVSDLKVKGISDGNFELNYSRGKEGNCTLVKGEHHKFEDDKHHSGAHKMHVSFNFKGHGTCLPKHSIMKLCTHGGVE